MTDYAELLWLKLELETNSAATELIAALKNAEKLVFKIFFD